MVRTIRSGVAVVLFLGASLAADAAGLGRLTVNSALGQILNAEIELVSLQPGELENLSARVASPEAFRDARIEYGGALRLLRFSVEKRANGQPYLKVTSVAPVNEPFLDVLLEVTWPQGRIQREYPILLDPPGYSQAKVTPPSAAASPPAATASAASTPPASAPAESSAPAASTAPAASEPTAPAASGAPSAQAELGQSAAPTPAGETYGPVQKGEYLKKIAEEVKPASVSLEQMLVALYRENPSAFAGSNMNRLKAGQILKVPTEEQVTQITNSDANKEIRTQVADWRAYREQLAGGVGAIPARPETSSAASGRVASAAVTPPPSPPTESKEVLKLSKSDTGKAAGKASGQDRINALQEEVTAKEKALQEANSRVADLEKQIRDMQRLMDLKAGAAPATKPGDTKVAAAPAKPEPPKVEAKPEPAKVEPMKPAEAPKVDTKVAEAPKPAEAPKVAEAPKPAEAPKTEAPKPAAKKPAPPPPPKSFVDEMLDSPLMLAGIGAGVLALAGGAFLFMRRRRSTVEEGPSSAMTSAFPSDLKPGSNTSKPAAGLVDTGNSSFLTDFDKTGPGTIDTDEVDPVAEAEVYIAYGRDAQAEEILKEAMARDRGRHEIALKLLEIYHARKSATAFETVAKELHAAVGDSSPMWQKAAAMGAQIDPTNPLYGGAGGAAASFTSAPAPAAAKPDVDFDLAGSSSAASEAPAPSFDLDLDAQRPSEASAPAPSSSGLDFDIAPGTPSKADAMEPPKEEKSSFDFDLSGLEMPSSGAKAPEPAPAPSTSSSFDLADLNLDSGSGGGGGGGGGDEAVGTKLELAKAYLEIGDKDGARDILQEVAKEGSAAQREEASKLIASL